LPKFLPDSVYVVTLLSCQHIFNFISDKITVSVFFNPHFAPNSYQLNYQNNIFG
jgi:hypothetical protein